MSTIKDLPAKAKRPRIQREVVKKVGSTKSLSLRNIPVKAYDGTKVFVDVMVGKFHDKTREVCLEFYWNWIIILKAFNAYKLNSKCLQRFVEAYYPAPRKLRGISPSKRLRERLHCFEKSVGIMWYNRSQMQEAQAFAQAS